MISYSALQDDIKTILDQTTPSFDPIVLKQYGDVTFLALNRPKALNSLDTTMIESIHSKVQSLEEVLKKDPASIKFILFQGLGGKAFCAGGDVKSLTSDRLKLSTDPPVDSPFFKLEYEADYAMAKFSEKVLVVALWDGIVMGGGVGISIHSRIRIVTERTRFAMPETAIGLIPDVGGSSFLSSLHVYISRKNQVVKNFGLFLGLTGYQLMGLDVFRSGLGNAFIPSGELPGVLDRALSDPANAEKIILDASKTFSIKALGFPNPDPASPFFSSAHLEAIDEVFGRESVTEIVQALADALKRAESSAESDLVAFLRKIDLSFKKASPLSLEATFESLRLGRLAHRHGMALENYKDAYTREFRAVTNILRHENDFYEGVRALLIDKDNKPIWRPSSLAEVDRKKVMGY
jgi:3-hydroxyisobutyryl-CoA hydrolase